DRRLIGELEHSGKLLRALAGMTDAMIRPGSSRQDVIDAVAGHLTDAAVPEFDFHFATVYLLGVQPDGGLAVQAAAGSARTESVDSAQAREGRERSRVPRWALDKQRPLADDDVLVHTARTRQTVVVGSAVHSDEVVSGPMPEPIAWTKAAAVRSDGTRVAEVPA